MTCLGTSPKSIVRLKLLTLLKPFALVKSLALITALMFSTTTAVRWFRRRFVVVTVKGPSMEPTFTTGDRVLARRASLDAVRTGDVVVVDSVHPATEPGPRPALPGDGHSWIIKRAVAVPGDAVPRDRVPALATVTESTVPPGKMVLLGDGVASADSRQSGYFEGDRLVGRVVARLWDSRP